MHEGHRQRLRNKLATCSETIEDHELLEILLFYVLPRVNTNPVAHDLIDTFGSLSAVLNAEPKLLLQVKGVGETTATYLSTLGEVFKRCKKVDDDDLPMIFSYKQIREPIMKLFSGLKEEVFVAYFLDNKQKIIAKKVICDHSPFKVDIDLGEITKQIVALSPKFVVIAHNHLSGICSPTIDDDMTTEKLCLALKLYNVNLVDHLIVTANDVYSYYYENRIDKIKAKVDAVF